MRDEGKMRRIEEALRRLPTPEAPEGLEGRLVAAIPEGCAAAPRRLWLLDRAALVAAAALIAFGLALLVPLMGGKRVDAAYPLGDTQPTRILPSSHADAKETDPCDILPPLYYWES